MSVGTCHQCGRKYGTAQALAGTTVHCRTCGAANDGAGGPPREGDGSGTGRKREGLSLDDAFMVGPPLDIAPTDPHIGRPADYDPINVPHRSPRSNTGLVVALVMVTSLIAIGGIIAISALRGTGKQGSEPISPPRNEPSIVKRDDRKGSPPAPVNVPPVNPAPTPPVLVTPSDPPPTMASRVDPMPQMSDRLYASSLLGLGQFDETFLSGKAADAAYGELHRRFVEPMGQRFAGVLGEVTKYAGERSLKRSIHGTDLLSRRPALRVHFPRECRDERVGIYLETSDRSKDVLSPTAEGLVSARSDVRLSGSGPAGECFQDTGSGQFVVPIRLPWRFDALRMLEQTTEVEFTLRIVYSDSSTDRLLCSTRIEPPTSIETSYPFGLGFATLVDEDHPQVGEIIADISKDHLLVGNGVVLSGAGSTSIFEQICSIALIWRELTLRGIRYQNRTGVDPEFQRCRLFHDCLADRSANCIDNTAMLASLLGSTGFRCYIVLLPGHALLGVALSDGKSSPILFVETTLLGMPVDEDPATQGIFADYFRVLREERSFLNGQSLNAFEVAVEKAEEKVYGTIDQATAVIAAIRAAEELSKAHPNDAAAQAEFDDALDALPNFLIVPISIARENGARPVGSPPSIGSRRPLPPRLPSR
jgi:hypothetical protein